MEYGETLHFETRTNAGGGTQKLWYYYDGSGVCGVEYNGSVYYFQKNLQGDVTRIYDGNGSLVAQYVYDAWGNHRVLNANGTEMTDESFIGNVNPIRYRGYYYDTDSGLYYLQSRYYDPEVGRFINADEIDYIEPETLMGCNLYAYCGNNPVMYADPTGNFPIALFFICIGIGAFAGATTRGVIAYNNGARGWDLFGQISLGALTGAALGATVGTILGMGPAAIVGGLSSMANKFISDVIASAVSQSWAFGTWEDYAIAFSFGGILKGVKIPGGKIIAGGVKAILDIAVRPLVNQITKMGTRGGSFDVKNYMWTVFSRAITYGFEFGKFTTTVFGKNLTITLGKSIYRGLFSGLWKKFN